MDFLPALRESMSESEWTVLRLARELRIREDVIYKWLRTGAVPAGATLIVLMRTLPGFAGKLGFVPRKMKRAA